MSLKNIITRSRGLGWLPNVVDKRDYSCSDLLGKTPRGVVPDDFSLLPEYKILNQSSTNSCVGNSAANAIWIAETKAGLKVELVSRLFLYFNSRAFEGIQTFDKGTTIRSCCKGLIKFGAPDERFWTFSTSPLKVNRRPGWNPYMMAYGRRGGSYFRIYEFGDELVPAIQTALLDGNPVIFGAKIARSFTANSGPVVIDKPSDDEAIVGGHAITIVGWKTESGKRNLQIVNSWGEGWRDGGKAYMTEDYMTSSLCSDFTIIKGWDRIKHV